MATGGTEEGQKKEAVTRVGAAAAVAGEGEMELMVVVAAVWWASVEQREGRTAPSEQQKEKGNSAAWFSRCSAAVSGQNRAVVESVVAEERSETEKSRYRSPCVRLGRCGPATSGLASGSRGPRSGGGRMR